MKPLAVDTAGIEALEDEHRWNPRSKVLKNVHIRYGGPLHEEQEAMVTLIDASRDGFYFTAGNHDCNVGMKLRLALRTCNRAVD